MIGKLNSASNKVTIVGGGFSGLSIAYFLDRAGYEVTLFEAQSRLGGLIETDRTPWGLAEGAAHSLLAPPAMEQFLKELNIPCVELRPDSKAKFILRNGRPRRFPLTFFEVLTTLFRAYFVLADRRTSPSEMTLQQWAQRHLGQGAARFLLSPMLRGIYGATLDRVTVGVAFPSLVIPPGHSLVSFKLAQLFRGLFKKADQVSGAPQKRGKRKILVPEGGMETVIRTLETHLRKRLGDRLKTGIRIDALPEAENLILTLPAEQLAPLLAPHDADLAKALQKVTYSPLVSVTVFVPKNALIRPPKGVGVLIGEGEASRCLGILFNSSSFSGRVFSEEWDSYTVFLGGTQEPKVLEASDEEIRARVTEELSRQYGLQPHSAQNLQFRIYRRKKAVPLYNADLARVWDSARKGWCSKPGQVLFCNYSGQVSLRGMIETLTQYPFDTWG